MIGGNESYVLVQGNQHGYLLSLYSRVFGVKETIMQRTMQWNLEHLGASQDLKALLSDYN